MGFFINQFCFVAKVVMIHRWFSQISLQPKYQSKIIKMSLYHFWLPYLDHVGKPSDFS
jgi:hypothetical protein